MKQIVALVIALCLLGICDARQPKEGDDVMICVMHGSGVWLYHGTITDISDEFLGVKVAEVWGSQSIGNDGWQRVEWNAPNGEVAIGTGCISELWWPNQP